MERLAIRNLTTSSISFKNSICPTRDLIALIIKSNLTNEFKINLYRTTGLADLTWEFINSNSNPVSTNSSNSGFKGKGKESLTGNEIKVLTWNEEGTYLAIGSTSSNSTPPISTLTILSVNNGKPLLPSLTIPTTSSTLTFITWQTLTNHIPDPILATPFTQKIILSLPRLPVLSTPSTASTAGTSGVVTGAAGGTASGVFGSLKNAALLKEREKDAGRKLNLIESTTSKSGSSSGFPRLIECRNLSEDGLDHRSSLLIVGDDNGMIHCYLGGTVFLGSFLLEEGSSIVSASIIPSPSTSTSSSTSIQISILLSSCTSTSTPSPPNSLISTNLSINLPKTLDILIEQSTYLLENLSHAFESLQEIKVLWDESRRIGKVWLGRLDELGRFHGASTPATTQLLLLLLTGRHPRSLHDFLTAKINERGLNKWELCTLEAFKRLKEVIFKSLIPSVEFIIMLLEEIRGWSVWPEKFGSFNLDRKELQRCILLASEIIKSSSELEFIVLEEERCFQAFTSWLHYELEKVALQEGSDVRPIARFQPIPVAHYIRHCLPSSPITPFLNFGPSTVSLDLNEDLVKAREWFKSLSGENYGVDLKREGEGGVGGEELMSFMKGMVEELKVQTNDLINSTNQEDNKEQNDDDDEEMNSSTVSDKEKLAKPSIDPDSESGEAGTDNCPKSLPVLLHLLAEILGNSMRNAVESVGKTTIVEKGQKMSEGSEGRSWTCRTIGLIHYRAWIIDNAIWISQRSLEGIETFAKSTQNSTTEILDFDFFDDLDLIFLLKINEQGTTKFELCSVSLSTFSFSATSPPNTPFIPTRSHQLDSQFPPQTISMNGRAGRRFICVIAGEGRRLEVLEYAQEEEEEGEEANGDRDDMSE